jgi:cytochrome c-type biogenesis protein CcmH
MTSEHIFWFAAGAMSGAAAFAVSAPVLRQLSHRHGPGRARAIAIGSIVLLAAVALGLYRMWGTPAAIKLDARETALVADMGGTGSSPAAPHSMGAASGAGKIGSVEEATARLAKRLNEQGGSAADWNLLAQSYEFMGRSADAAEARKRAASAPATAASATPSPAAAKPAPAPVVSPEAAALLAQAEKARIAHDTKKALQFYAKAESMNALTADAWANYADATASAGGGRLSGKPEQYLQRALQLDPDHPKALWLQASLYHEQKAYAKAVDVWRHLARIIPADSSDAKIIAANIAEAARLSGDNSGASAAPAKAAAGSAAQIDGVIDIDPKLRAKAQAGQVLFVFAKAVNSPGPPLAVVRTTVGQWPVKFSLNDSQAMTPQRKLSDFGAVTVEARISASGQPLAQAGDLHGVTGSVDPRGSKPLRVVISEVVGS